VIGKLRRLDFSGLAAPTFHDPFSRNAISRTNSFLESMDAKRSMST